MMRAYFVDLFKRQLEYEKKNCTLSEEKCFPKMKDISINDY